MTRFHHILILLPVGALLSIPGAQAQAPGVIEGTCEDPDTPPFTVGGFVLDLNGNGAWDEVDLWAKLGKKGDQPVSGDWDGDGKTDIGIFGPAWIGDLKAVSVEPGLPDAQNPPMKARPKNVPPEPADAAVGWRTMKKGNAGQMRSRD